MSEPIKVGDLVIVVKAHCPNDHTIGRVYVVQDRHDGWARCQVCGHQWDMVGGFGLTPYECAERDWLKRIPPLSELDDVKKDEEIHA